MWIISCILKTKRELPFLLATLFFWALLCREEQLENFLTVPVIRLLCSRRPECLKTRVCVDDSTKLLNLPHIWPPQELVASGSVADGLQELEICQIGRKMTGKKIIGNRKMEAEKVLV